jgi:hypothetical protein
LISPAFSSASLNSRKVRRTPRDIYRSTESSPLFVDRDGDVDSDTEHSAEIPLLDPDEGEDIDSSAPIVTIAIYVNLVANAALLAGKIAVTVTTSSVSVLASLVDALLDFLSTAIVWTTTWLISRQDRYRYPVGRRR